MLNGDGNESGKKKSVGLMRKKNNFARPAHFFVHFFFSLFCMTTT